MVWNLQYQFAGLMIVMVVIAMSIGQKKLNFSAEKSFTRLLFLVTTSIVFDIISIFAINYKAQIGDVLCDIICKIYLFSITCVACQSSWFTVAEIRYTFKKFWVYATTIPVIIEAVVLFVVPIQYHISDGEIYTYGFPVMLTYAFCGLYLVSALVVIIVLRDQINEKRRYAIAFWLIAWLFTAVIQFANNEFLIVSFSMALACIYMYLKLENPEYRLDFATNVFNKSGFNMIIGETLSFDEHKSMVVFAVKDLGRINEIFGSRSVENLIISIASFAEKIKESVLFRIEDNVFCLVLSDREAAESAVDNLIKRFRKPWEISGAAVDIKISTVFIEDIGYFNDVDALDEVIHYFIRESISKDISEVTVVNEEELKKRQHSIEIRNALEWALKNDGVEVHYQPVYDIKSGKFTSLEALVRIRDENGTLIYPGEFIEHAERNGMIIRLGTIVFRKVCEFMQRMHVEEYGIEFIEVNLSVVQCMQEDLARNLENIMGEYQIPPYRINFEITESAAASSHNALIGNMKELMDYGSGFSLDDYGSGYSNLAYVIELPLKIIKLDRSLVCSFAESEKVRIATETTIEMIHKLGMKIVVEGVETEEMYRTFSNLGVEYIQGYYFSKPLPKEQVLNYIQEWL